MIFQNHSEVNEELEKDCVAIWAYSIFAVSLISIILKKIKSIDLSLDYEMSIQRDNYIDQYVCVT